MIIGTPAQLIPFAQAMTNSLVRITTGIVGRDFQEAGLTPDLQKAWKLETEDAQNVTFQSFYFTWSRKRVMESA